jgi:predicted small lipoprotein YifL
MESPTGKSLIQAAMVAALTLLALTACGTRYLDDAKVAQFIDKADDAARKRFAPAICSEKLPFYEAPPSTASDYLDVQVLETLDHSRVGIEDGDIVFLSTDADITQTLVPKNDMPLPYN